MIDIDRINDVIEFDTIIFYETMVMGYWLPNIAREIWWFG